jgi:chaperonin GroES
MKNWQFWAHKLKSEGSKPAKIRYKPVKNSIFAHLKGLVRNSFTFAHFKTLKIKNYMAKKLNITPLHDRVVVKPAAAEEKTAGGIIIPDTAKEKPQRGVVVAAGPGKKDEPVTVKIGDTVLYGKYAGTELTVEGDDLLIMRESDILAIV